MVSDLLGRRCRHRHNHNRTDAEGTLGPLLWNEIAPDVSQRLPERLADMGLVEQDPRYFDALSALIAPCCDDNAAFSCCCERGGESCNIIRSGKGLAAHLIYDLDLETEQIRASVLDWFRFARPDYYLAAELTKRGVDPAPYGLTIEGSCYRGLCDTPISQGGCGGMQELIEPAIGTADG